MSEREKVDTYTIPPNFAESGKWFSGRVSAGNVVEAAVMSLILLKILLQVPVDEQNQNLSGNYIYSSSCHFCCDRCAGRTIDSLFVSYFMFFKK